MNMGVMDKFLNAMKLGDVEDEYDNDDYYDEDEIEGLLGKDKPIRIVSAKKHKDLPTELLCEIEWKVRKDGTQPKNSFYKNEDIKKKEPLILVEFYEKQYNYCYRSSFSRSCRCGNRTCSFHEQKEKRSRS